MVNLFAKFERLSASPGAYKDLWSLNSKIDVKPILSTVRVPTLVLHRRHDAFVSVECGRVWQRKTTSSWEKKHEAALDSQDLHDALQCIDK